MSGTQTLGPSFGRVPLPPDAEWAAVSNVAERFVAVATKAKRKGRIFIDWLRNQRGESGSAESLALRGWGVARQILPDL